MYKNSVKLVFSNFKLVWKLLIFFILTASICGTIGYFVTSAIYNNLGLSDIFQQFPEVCRDFIKSFDIKSFLISIEAIMNEILGVLTSQFATQWYLILAFVLLAIILPSMINNFYLMASCNVLHYYMGSSVNFGFTASIFCNFWKNVRYQLVCLVTLLPMKLITYYCTIKSFWLLTLDSWVSYFAPFITIVVYVVLTAIRVALFSGWVPCMVVKNTNVFSGLIIGTKSIGKRLPQIFANSIGVVLTIIIITVLGIFTFGVSLIITAPAAFLLIAVFDMVAFYSSTGLRYYVDNNNVYAPKKTEMIESYKIYKNVI